MKFSKLKFKKKHLLKTLGMSLWFLTGALMALFFVLTFSFLIFERLNHDRIYPGIFVAGKNLAGMTYEDVQKYFQKRNEGITTYFEFTNGKEEIATISAKEIGFGYDDRLFATQAYSIGRTKRFLTDSYLILKAYTNGIYLTPSYKYSQEALSKILLSYSTSIDEKPINAQFKFENGKVTTFQPSSEGRTIDWESLDKRIISTGQSIIVAKPKIVKVAVPIKILQPAITTESVNTFGIKDLIASGSSHFAHSITQRIHNITLATSRINGALVAPGKTFSFDSVLGDVSLFTGYQQAYIIKEGKTVLGDGGGVCQVSTTLFRAILNAGLPIIERSAHAYRVGYYEQDSPPGLDATTYVPTVDLKFKNDTQNYVLIQSAIDYNEQKLEFFLYGAKDGREVFVSKPVVSEQTPAPPPSFQDDPTLPKGELKQIDFEASGAKVEFTRTVKKNGKVIIFDKFTSIYQPWQAVYLRGTKE